MRALLIPLALAGCESMAPSGNPFTPVEVTAPAPAAELAPVTDPRFDTEEFQLSSEELHAGAVAARKDEAPPAAVPEATAEPAAEPKPSQPSEGATPTTPAPTAPMASGWPVRLVRTLPDTQPPRAILGLPDGTEIVVRPGSMVPDQGLVVIAVGREQVELARVTAMGDYASVSSLTLSSL